MTTYAIIAAIVIAGASYAGIIELKPSAIDATIDTRAGFRVTPTEQDARTILLERKLVYFLSLVAIGALVLVFVGRRRIGDTTLNVAAKGLQASRRIRRRVGSVAKEVDRRSRS